MRDVYRGANFVCELLAMSSSRPAQLTFSLEILASHSDSAGSSRDGWGAAYYEGNDVALFREPSAAYDSPLVRFLEANGPCASLIISHIRHATHGSVALENTQPFVREVAGRTHVFAHNGDLSGIEQESRLAFGRYRPVGTTDSEHAFCALLERIARLWDAAASLPPVTERLRAISDFAADLRSLGPANFIYADGDVLFAHGHRRIQRATGSITPPGLWLLSRRCAMADEPVRASGVSIAPGFQELVLVASVPLSEEHWRPLGEGELVALAAGQVLDAATAADSSVT